MNAHHSMRIATEIGRTSEQPAVPALGRAPIGALDDRLRMEMRGLVAQWFEDPAKVLDLAIGGATHVYTARRVIDGALQGMSFARRATEDPETPTWYIGLSVGTRDGTRSHPVRTLWNMSIKDAAEEQAHLGRPLIVWYRTATPFAVHISHALLDAGEPRLDGSYTEAGRTSVAAIRRRFNLPCTDQNQHPFVLPRFTASRFLEAERRRIRAAASTDAARLLERLGIDEARGDRLIMIGAIPHHANTPQATT